MSGNRYPPSHPIPSSGQPGGDPFAPEVVDEQIAVRLGASGLQPRPDAETRLVRAMTTLYPLPPNADHMLTRARERVHAAQVALPPERRANNTRTVPSRPSTGGSTGTSNTPPPSHRRGILASVAAVVVVALLIGAFARLLSTRSPASPTPKSTPIASPSAPAPTGTPAATPKPTTVAGAQWVPMPGLNQQQGLPDPIIAPTDANVAYIIGTPSAQCKGCTVPTPAWSRTGDGGQTWQNISVPGSLASVSSASQYLFIVQVSISPYDAQVVFVTLSGQSNATCQAMGSQQRDCMVTFRSGDGGQHWQQLSFPVLGAIEHGPLSSMSTNLIRGSILVDAGQHLYAPINTFIPPASGQVPAGRLVVSADQGQTWQVADAPLAASNQGIVDFTADPISGALYATTEQAGQSSVTFTPTYQFWSSSDSGAHWTQRTLPAKNVWLIAAAPNGSGIVYLSSTTTTRGNLTLFASTDGGQTWTQAPNTGLPGGAVLTDGPLGVLGNGSPVFTANGAMVAWQPGTRSWVVLAGPPADSNQLSERDVTLTVFGNQPVLVVMYSTGDTDLAARVSLFG